MSYKTKKELNEELEDMDIIEDIKPSIKSKPVKIETLVFERNRKTINVDFLKGKYKTIYDVELTKETNNELVFEGKTHKIIVNKV
jgi:hypothetical protein